CADSSSGRRDRATSIKQQATGNAKSSAPPGSCGRSAESSSPPT
ncbi:MAG: hypothetical protein AVDCRST_MAG40-2998, partial [uncultured Gemmatimonadaceae bacterium]